MAAAFVAGVAAGVHNLALALLGVGLGLAIGTRALGPVVCANALGALVLGFIDGELFGHPAPAPLAHVQMLQATVVEALAREPTRSELVVRMEDGSGATVSVPDPAPVIGERLVLRGKLEELEVARNPGEPSPRELGAERGIAAHLSHARILAREGVDSGDASLWIARMRAWASGRLHDELPEPDATILAGALWGERGALPPDLRGEFQDTGTMHVLVTAGLHLGVVAWLAVGMLSCLGCGRISASLGAIGLVWCYALFSGAHLPSLRAATMISFALGARAAGREAFSWNALAAAAIVVAAIRPASVTSLSFALSFSCVGAILLFAKPLANALESVPLPHAVREAVALTFATQIGTWPLTAAGFLVFAPYAPLANACVVPVVGVAMLAGFAELAAAPVAPLAHLCANVETSLLDWIVGVVRTCASLPGAHVVMTPPPPWTIACYDAALVGSAALLARGRRAGAAAVFCVACALCLWPPRSVSHDLVITAIDVGQADALLVRTPRGHAYLVDAGGRLERGPQLEGASSAEQIGERVVVPFLIREGIHRVDAVVLSHPHGDHVGGLPPVLRTLGSGAFADSGQAYAGHAYHDALDVAHERGIPMLEPRGGDVWRTDDGVTLRFYGPTYPYISGSRNDINNNSLVFRLEYGRFRMLFTGDAGAETEERLLASGADLSADVLKVGHHGSAYGTTPAFVRAVSPGAAVISVGRDNLFGHPAPATIATLERAGAHVYRTDVDGAITIGSDGSRFSVEPYVIERGR